MKITKTEQNIAYCGHKTPKYIYHFTNKKSYEAIKNSGIIKPSQDFKFGKAIFFTEFANFFKRWPEIKFESKNLQAYLIQQAAKDYNDIVLLRIPTKHLKKDKLFIRSQNKLVEFLDLKYDDLPEVEYTQDKNGNKVPVCKYIQKTNYKYLMHLTFGELAKFSKLYKQRKEAIEYMYKDEIPFEYVEKIGETDISEYTKNGWKNLERNLQEIFKELLKNSPEFHWINFLKP